MKFLTWNVDGLCTQSVLERTQRSLAIILSEAPDLIFLQEVIPPTAQVFSDGMLCKGYRSAAAPPRGAPYFTMCFYNPATIKIQNEGECRVQYTGDARSRMGRDILQLMCEYQPQQERSAGSTLLLALNSHLESEKGSADVRTAQLTQLARLVHEEGCRGRVAIIAGDLNMRDLEARAAVQAVRALGGDPCFDLNDAYFHFGRPKELSKTWIMPDKPMVGCRFDRIYHSCHSNNVQFQSLRHVGTSKIPSLGMTPSDHCGLVLEVELNNAGGEAPRGLVVGAVKETAAVIGGKRKAAAPAKKTHVSASAISPSPLAAATATVSCVSVDPASGTAPRSTSHAGEAELSSLVDEDDDEEMKLALLLSMKEVSQSVVISTVSMVPQQTQTQTQQRSTEVSEKEARRAGFLKALERRARVADSGAETSEASGSTHDTTHGTTSTSTSKEGGRESVSSDITGRIKNKKRIKHDDGSVEVIVLSD